jgi:hypothetical protein
VRDFKYLRDALSDPYADALQAQNEGKACTHCHSRFGHYSVCPLINRETAEAHSIALGNVTESDRIISRGWGIKWES